MAVEYESSKHLVDKYMANVTKYEKIYQTLREEFSDQEIADGYVFPDDLDQKEKERFQKQQTITWNH